MILPIIAYGHPILKKRAQDIENDYEGLQELIEDMWSTMYNAQGVGLAAPQIGKSIRLFLIDTIQVMEDDEKEKGIKQAFINPTIIEEAGSAWAYEEGCLSIPNIRGDVERLDSIKIKYFDTEFNEHRVSYDKLNARVIQHEYDHLEGKLFLDYLKPVKKRLIKRKLESIKRGTISTDYKMKFYRLA